MNLVSLKKHRYKSPGLSRRLVYMLIISMVISITGRAQSTAGTTDFLLFDGTDLKAIAERYHTSDPATVARVNTLLAEADFLLNTGPYSVTFFKLKAAPGNNKHDYLSQAPYWWPDPAKADGKPYIRKDGQRNPEIYQLHDASQMEKMGSSVKKLSLAYYFTGKDAYAQKAEALLKPWFVDPKTAMSPNLNYAQYVPGVNDGRGIGIIETARLLPIPDAVTLLQKSKISPLVITGVKTWFKAYTNWLLNSKNGKDERSQTNNHGTYYDLQVVVYALFTGDRGLAEKVINEFTIPRMGQQFTPEGLQPLELARTRGWDYSNMNLMAWCRLAAIARQLNIDLWHKTTADGKGIEKAIAFLLPYATGQKPWNYQEIGKFEYGNIKRMVHMAKGEYPTLPINEFYKKFPESDQMAFLN